VSHIDAAAEYPAEIRRLEMMRNEALRHRDRPALAALHLRLEAVNGVF
jgi:hypothetical protein